MNTKQILTGVVFTLSLSTLPVHATEPLDVKLGLWETTETTQMSGAIMPDSVLKGMPPEARARMEAAMKKRQSQVPKSHTYKTCLTQKDLSRPFGKQKDTEDDKCTNTILTATRTVQEYKMECGGSAPHSGVMRIEALSRERIKSTMKMNMNSSRGVVNMEISGRWLAADCGKERY